MIILNNKSILGLLNISSSLEFRMKILKPMTIFDLKTDLSASENRLVLQVHNDE